MGKPIQGHAPLSNVQLELLKLYGAGVKDEYLAELKDMMAHFLFEKSREQADAVWDEK
ncbi:MAG: hypothetical protein LH606_10085 [Cytophagaceae bacterium]|nr:hypothetical protein [Cytophagaceae bacterium]